MSYFTNNEGVIEAFLNQQTANAGKLKTDGQSLFSYDLRIAEHIAQKDGTAVTVVYDYTKRGGAYKSHTTSSHVSLIKRRIPRQNFVSVQDATVAGLSER